MPKYIIKLAYVKGGTSDALVNNCEFDIPNGSTSLLSPFCISEKNYLVSSANNVEKQKVEVGEDGWLFLHNDSNGSVDQYTGRRLLDARELSAWEKYFNGIKTLSKELDFSWVFFIAPGKEFIFPNYYPFKRATRTPVDQFLEKFQDAAPIIWPEKVLSDDREITYWKGDTHWTDYGAAVGARSILSAFGFNRFERLDTVRYVIKHRTGDLGGKLTPPKMYSVVLADFGEIPDYKIFDNQIHNHGRIRVFECPTAESQHVCVLFGDSFSIGLVPWVTPFFRRLVFVHTAGSVDRNILKSERPTHVIFQSNSRFLISPAKSNFLVDDLIKDKLKLLGREELAMLQEKMMKQQSPKTSFYIDLMHKLSNAVKEEGTSDKVA